MPRTRLHPRIKEFQKRESPINYSNLSVTQSGRIETRKSSLDDRIVEGYALIWGSKNDYGEVFIKGCCAKAISDLGPNSNSNYKIKFRDRHGKSVSLFAELKEDDIGLYFKTVPLDKVGWADDLLVQLKSGTINNFSIGFRHCWDKVEWDDENDSMLNLEIHLFEISAVDIPSDIETYAMRSIEEPEYLMDDIEEFIDRIPKSMRIEARHMFTRCMTLSYQEQQETNNRSALKDKKEAVKKDKGIIDYSFLNKNL